MPRKTAARSGRRPETAKSEGAEITRAVAENLQALRRARGYSLEDVAQLSGVSRATLSQIEGCKTNPTLALLWKISAGLSVPFSTLLGAASEAAVTIFRHKDQPVLRSEDGALESRALTPPRAAGPVEVYELKLAARSRHDAEPHPSGTVEVVIVLGGVLRLHVADNAHDAAAGDSLCFRADRAHAYENPGRTEARLCNVIVYGRA